MDEKEVQKLIDLAVAPLKKQIEDLQEEVDELTDIVTDVPTDAEFM